MEVKFVVLQTNGKENREQPLFTESWGRIYFGQLVKYRNRRCQVSEIEWIDRKNLKLKAICKEFRYTGQKQLIPQNT